MATTGASSSVLPIFSPAQNAMRVPDTPMLFGFPLKYVSLVVLALQNATSSLIMHYSRVSASPEKTYSAASAVLLNELFKGLISFALSIFTGYGTFPNRVRTSISEIFQPDCIKLSLPAILYVVQNNLQYIAISNLDAATFQVTNQMKILTTAFFTVVLLRRTISRSKWISLILLTIGVGVVQVQAGLAAGSHPDQHSNMDPTKGFVAVVTACFTSGLAGVYFEMVLKNSKTDLWIRNVQLSMFSLLPAALPILFSHNPTGTFPLLPSQLLRNFSWSAWATVGIQVFGGLITAVVIKYSDNILKGFATSLAIVMSFLASVILFSFPVTIPFVVGVGFVLWATYLYSQPDSSSSEKRPTTDVEYESVPIEPLKNDDDATILRQRSSEEKVLFSSDSSISHSRSPSPNPPPR